MPAKLEPSRIGLVTVTYNPDEGFVGRLQEIGKSVGGCVVVDNGSADATRARLKPWRDESHQDLILNDRNQGLAYALNQGIRRAIERGFEWALLMDDDSVIHLEWMRAYEAAFLLFSPRDIAVIGNNYGVAVAQGMTYLLPPGKAVPPAIPFSSVITAGSLLSLANYQKLGPFRDDFFIDWVDAEYGFRARRHGLKVVLVTRSVVTQKLGGTTRVQSPLGEAHPSHHSPMRRYFMMRNLVLLFKAYGFSDPNWFLCRSWETAKIVGKIILFENQKGEKLGHMMLGLWDGLFSSSKSPVRIRRMLAR